METVADGPKLDGRIATPIWLTNTDYPAPCTCGYGFSHGDQVVMVHTDEGLKRLMHLGCIPGGMLGLDEDE
jgi:hypothetical protein